MAHFAKLNADNIVEEVIVVSNDELMIDGVESEEAGVKFCQDHFGKNTKWVQTSYSGSFRYRYAGINYFYDKDLDAFIRPKPFDSWILNSSLEWEAPISHPEDGNEYEWNEENLQWDQKPSIS